MTLQAASIWSDIGSFGLFQGNIAKSFTCLLQRRLSLRWWNDIDLDIYFILWFWNTQQHLKSVRSLDGAFGQNAYLGLGALISVLFQALGAAMRLWQQGPRCPWNLNSSIASPLLLSVSRNSKVVCWWHAETSRQHRALKSRFSTYYIEVCRRGTEILEQFRPKI